MPTTVNGIGTTYFGRRNRRQFDGVCQFCHQPSKLENYETWLVLSVFFVPVIPLAKKQVLNYCPRCSRHMVVKFSQWKKARQEALERASAELAANEHDPDAAIKMHGTFEAYQQGEDAARFAEAMLTLFGDVARVQFYLGGWYERVGRKADADQCFSRAFALEPENLAYKRAVAIGHIEHGNLPRARAMLADFEPTSQAFEPALFIMLAQAHQRQRQHDEALAAFKLLLAARPALAADKAFRKIVRISERAVGQPGSLVTREPFYRSPVLWAAAVVLLLLAGFLGGNAYVRKHRTLYLVNGLPVPIVVDVDGAHTVNVGGQGHASLVVAEGPHRAVVREPKLGYEPVEFSVGSNWFTGLFRSPAFVVDPSRSAVVFWQEVVYSAAPANQPGGASQFHFGDAFINYPHVDYPFQEFPRQLDMGRRRQLRKTKIGLYPMPREELLTGLLAAPNVAQDALGFVESHLRASPDDIVLLSAYSRMGRRQNQLARCRDFLATRLGERPVLIGWHRIYQSVRQLSGDDGALAEQYDAFLASDPNNSALLYLRGRIDPDRAAAWKFYEKAIEADPDNAYAYFAQSGVLLSRGDFAAAKEPSAAAHRLRPADPEMKWYWIRIRMALGEFDSLEAELRAAVQANPLSMQEQQQLLAVLVAANKTDQAEQAVQTFSQQVATAKPAQAPAFTRYMKNQLLYLQGDFQGLLAASSSASEADAAVPRYWAQFELGQAVTPPPGVKTIESVRDEYPLLCQSLAWAEQGNASAAAEAKAQAIEQFRTTGLSGRRIAELLGDGADWTEQDLDDLPVDPTHKCIVLVSMAESRPDRAAPLLDLAEKLNFERQFPHHFLKRTIAHLRQRGDTAQVKP